MRCPAKLVRDHVPEVMKREGLAPVFEVAPRRERLGWLLDKLLEETTEIRCNPIVDEVVDVLEVLRAIAEDLGHTWPEIEHARRTKAKAMGSFELGIVLRLDEDLA